MKKHKISLSTKTFSFFILFSAITILIVSLVQSSLLPFIYEKTKKNNLNDSLTSVITNFYLSDADLQNTCDDIALYYGTSILITDEEFNPIVSSRGITSEDLTKYSRDVLAMLTSRAISNGGSYQEKVHIFLPNKPDNAFIEEKSSPFIPNDDLESLIQVAITSSDTGLNRIIFISAVLSASNEMVKTNQILLLLIFIIMILLSLILAFIFSHSLSRPIVEMNDEAQKLMEGNFDVAFEENTGTKEIDELGTKLNQAAKELGKVDRLRSELVANISHDLRTPLTLITGYSEMMRDLPGEANEENLTVVINESKRLSSLVNDVLDLSKYSSEKTNRNFKPFNLTDSIQATINSIQPFIKNDGFELTFDHNEDVIVSGDESSISRVLYNLIQNAINYSGTSRLVEIRQSLDSNEVRIEVIDHGVGIAKEELPYIFDRYYRSSSNHERAIIGSGLGLSIVKAILERHNAKFGVRSSPGLGSTFWFVLEITQ